MTVYIDTETTGLSPQDEVVEIAVIGDDGKILLNSLVRPVRHRHWPEAERIHGISPEKVARAPCYEDLRPHIRRLFQDQDVVIYNRAYDSQYLGTELSTARNVLCCMLAFAEHYGEWNAYYGNYKWQNLKTASRYVLHQWQGEAHRALADAQATRAVWQYLTIPEIRGSIDERRNMLLSSKNG